MLDMAQLACFSATARPGEARRFYGKILGLHLVEETAFALVFDANGTSLRIQKAPAHDPAAHTALGWVAPDLRGMIHRLILKGVRFERYAPLQQDDDAIWTAPGGAQVAWFKDPDGNVISLSEDPR
ncbi:MAG: VOC family protein [Candidatus Hydrogenedentes bacterium]|nr:VOC family protein [Candidatus Hydrogenedentota bacterium]